ncbi:MAG: hypothetical protein H6861_07240 [Rhodospirillales bacterium]|nr:hypothetical protein [Rhodospirillales bacterium]
MADDNSATTPDKTENTDQDKNLTPKFTAADNGATTPDVNAPKGDAPADKNIAGSREKINPEFKKTAEDEAAKAKKKKKSGDLLTRDLTDIERETGERWIKDENGRIIGVAVFSNPKLSTGSVFSKLFQAIFAMFSSDEMAAEITLNALYPPGPKYPDYNDIVGGDSAPKDWAFDTQAIALQQKKDALKEVIKDKNHPDRQLSPKDFVSKLIGDDAAIKAIEPQLNRLMDAILTKESNGDPTVIYDYRNKTLPGQGPGVNGYWTGLHPGDKTQLGTVVPDITKMTVNEVIDWQAKYLNEQYSIKGPDGEFIIPGKTGSPAAGAFQFVWGTLKHERDIGHIDGNRLFDWEAQTELAAKRYMLRIENATKGAKTVNEVETRLYKEFGEEWESLKGDEIKQLMREIAQALKPEPPAQVASASPTPPQT